MLGWTTLTEGDVLRWINHAPLDVLGRLEEQTRRRREELDVCEHGVRCGDWCEPCNREYKRARQAAYGEDNERG